MKKGCKFSVKEKCTNCKTNDAEYECCCGLSLCRECSEDGEICPADEMISHEITKIKY